MTDKEFRDALAAHGFTQRAFAAYVAANERTVRRWAAGEQDIPGWVPVLLRLLDQVAAATATRGTVRRSVAWQPAR